MDGGDTHPRDGVVLPTKQGEICAKKGHIQGYFTKIFTKKSHRRLCAVQMF